MILFETRLEGFLHWSAVGCGAMILVALFLSAWRMAVGPTREDRVVALDLITILMVAFLALFALATRRDAYLDAALALALVAFLATIGFARYVERAGRRDP